MDPEAAPSVDLSELPTDAVLLDVREDEEWRAGHVDGAVHVPMNSVPAFVRDEEQASGLAKLTGPLVVVCRSGHRSGQVTAWLNSRGVAAVNLDGGMLAWASSGRPMISADGGPPRIV